MGLFLSFCFIGNAQDYLAENYVKIKNVTSDGVLKFVSFKTNSNIPLAKGTMLLQEVLKIEGANTLEKSTTEMDVFGAQHDIYKQYFNSVEVAYNSYKVHSKNGFITSINGTFSNIELPTTIANLKSSTEVLSLGLNNLGASYAVNIGENITGKLLVLPSLFSANNEDRYAYVYKLASSTYGIEEVYLDALSGEVLLKDALMMTHASAPQTEITEAQIDYVLRKSQKDLLFKKSDESSSFLDTGTAETRYSGTKSIETVQNIFNYNLTDEGKDIYTKDILHTDPLVVQLMAVLGGMGAVDVLSAEFKDDDNNWTTAEHSDNKDTAALDVHWGITQVYDFFLDRYNRDSFDGAGAKIRSYVHVGNEYINAAWLGLSANEGGMIYGDGNYDETTGTGAYDALVSLDVTAHELGHAIDGAEGGLVYQRESGALNESFSDIWGSVVEFHAAPEKEKWIMGEDFVLVAPRGIRSMDNPKLFNQPDTYLGQFWKDATTAGCPTPDSTNDNCGVHTNSGVFNYWFYLLSDGGNGTNDNNYDYDVTGIGIEKATDIIYATETSYVESGSVYEDVKNYTIEATIQLYGDGSPEVLEVEKAWCAVGLETAFCDPTAGVSDFGAAIFKIYPNPADSELNISSSKVASGTLSYTISNTIGQRIQSGKISNNKIDVSSLVKGVYILSLEGPDSGKYNHKFIKQ